MLEKAENREELKSTKGGREIIFYLLGAASEEGRREKVYHTLMRSVKAQQIGPITMETSDDNNRTELRRFYFPGGRRKGER